MSISTTAFKHFKLYYYCCTCFFFKDPRESLVAAAPRYFPSALVSPLVSPPACPTYTSTAATPCPSAPAPWWTSPGRGRGPLVWPRARSVPAETPVRQTCTSRVSGGKPRSRGEAWIVEVCIKKGL